MTTLQQVKEAYESGDPIKKALPQISFSGAKGKQLLRRCLKEIPYSYLSAVLGPNDLINLLERIGFGFSLDQNGVKVLCDLATRFKGEENIKTFFQSLDRNSFVENLLMALSYQREGELQEILSAFSPFFDGDKALRNYFKSLPSAPADDYFDMVHVLSTIEPWVSKIFIESVGCLDAKDDDFPRFHRLAVILGLASRETIKDLKRLVERELLDEDEEDVLEFLAMNAGRFKNMEAQIAEDFLQTPSLKNARNFFVAHKNDPISQLKPLVKVWDSRLFCVNGDMEMGFEKHLSNFSLSDFAVIKELIKDFIKEDAERNFLKNVFRHLQLLDILGITPRKKFEGSFQEKWTAVAAFFSEERIDYWNCNDARDLLSLAEKRKMEQMFSEEDVKKTARVKI